MPLAASLRKRPSARNLHDLQDGTSLDEPNNTDGARGGGLLRPQSVAALPSRARPSSLFDGKDEDSVPSRPITAAERPISASTWKSFNLLKQRHASDPQLSARYRQEQAPSSGSSTPSACPAPVIGVTSPPWETSKEDKPKRKFYTFAPRSTNVRSISYNAATNNNDLVRTSTGRMNSFRSRRSITGNDSPDQKGRFWSNSGLWPSSANAMPSLNSSRFLGERSPASPASTPKTSTSAANLFKLPRRKKQRQESLFPLPVHLSPSNVQPSETSFRASTIFPVQPSPIGSSHSDAPPPFAPKDSSTWASYPSDLPLPPPSGSAGTASGEYPSGFIPPAPQLMRPGSSNSAPTMSYTEGSFPPNGGDMRGRSGTMGSFTSRRGDDRAPTPFHESVARTSMTSTTLGRNSIAGLRSFTSKLRHPSEPSPRHGSPSGANSTKNNSVAMSKEIVAVPDREEGESAAQYYGRLEDLVPKKAIGQLFAKSSDPFSHDVLRSLMRTFKFFEEPMDISLRKFLWEIDLPTETQQIDRLISAFAQRYFECNPPLFDNADEVYLLAFSLVVLHSDLFNKSNKHKMQRHEYQKNTRDANVDAELLGYFYDNIQYTEFIAQDDDDADSAGRSKRAKARKKVRKIKVAATEDGEKGKIDPYDFILDNRRKLEQLRPALKGVMHLEDTYHYFGTAKILDIKAIRRAFYEPCMLQTISSRSRPDAFREQATIDNPYEASAGVVEIKVAKVGIVWRKDPKKKPARSPWQEWGVLLTQSQLHFFRNKDWVKELIKQAENHHKQRKDYEAQLMHIHESDKLEKLQMMRDLDANKGVVFRPPVQDFKPDYTIKTPNTTALLDTSYDKHKNGFLLVNTDDFSEETLLADNEKDMNDWLAKINFASAFTSAKIDIKPSEILSDQSAITVIVTNKNGPAPNESVDGASEDQSVLTQGQERDTTVDIKTARQHMICGKIEDIGNLLLEAKKKLIQQLKTARHLQILAPFPPATRSDMLQFGARCAHRVRWTRFEIWRLKSHRDMLSADLINEPCAVEREAKPDPTIKTASPRLLPTALSRLNSKASAIMQAQKNSRSGLGHREHARPSLTRQGTDFAGSMDQALSVPADLTRSASSGQEGPYKLPPLVLTSTEERPSSSGTGTESLARRASVISTASHLAPAARSSNLPVHSAVKPEDSVLPLKKRPSTAIESEKDQQTAFGSPTTKSGNRRSLQRTLRESREIASHSRSRRTKDSVSSTGVDDNSSTHDKEQLSRAPGSFTLHGKKASVITLGSEFQHLPAEERLKARKQALAQENRKGRTVSESVEEDDSMYERPTSALSSHVSHLGSSHSLLEAPVVGNDGASLEYLAKGNGCGSPGGLKRHSSSTAVGDTEDEYITEPDRGEEADEFYEPLESFRDRVSGAIETSLSLNTVS